MDGYIYELYILSVCPVCQYGKERDELLSTAESRLRIGADENVCVEEWYNNKNNNNTEQHTLHTKICYGRRTKYKGNNDEPSWKYMVGRWVSNTLCRPCSLARFHMAGKNVCCLHSRRCCACAKRTLRLSLYVCCSLLFCFFFLRFLLHSFGL